VDILSDDNEGSVQSDEEEVTVINDEVVFYSNIGLVALIDLNIDWKSFFESLKSQNTIKK